MRKFAALILLVVATNANANYPAKPVRLIVPFTAGSATDQVGRLIGQQLQAALGQPFVVENRPGAQGSIAASEVARAAPDGYTLLVTTNTPQAANVSLFKKLPYDPVKDFTPVVRMGTTSFVLMTKSDFPARNLKEFIAHVKGQPGKLSEGYGSAGSQVSGSMLKSMAHLDFVEAPYKGIPQAVTDVLGGSLAFTFVDLGNALGQLKGGKMKGLGVTSEKRSAVVPDIPAIAETLPGYELIAWFALMAPANTPKEVVAKLQDASLAALARSEIKEKFLGIGVDVAPMNSEQLGTFIRTEIVKWARLTKEAGIQPE